MAKRSQRRRSRAAQPGCMWNLMCMFDLRHGRSTTKFLVDRKRESKHGIQDAKDSMMPRADAPRASVKELMDVEMINEQGLVSQSNDSEIKLERSGSKSERNTKKKQKRKTRNRSKSCDMGAPELNGVGCSPENLDRVPEQKLLNNLDLEAAMEELVQISQRNTKDLSNNSSSAPDLLSGQDVAAVEKLVTALKLVMEERLSGSKHSTEEGNDLPEEFVAALQTLSVNKGLLLKFLQDQNSALVKHFQKLVDVRADEDQKPAFDLSEEKQANAKPQELSSRKHWSFFRRNKSVESDPLAWDKDYPSIGRIVVLKPGSAVARSPICSFSDQSPCYYTDDDKAHGDGNPSAFSFTNFKRKLLHAMGKERQVISPRNRNLTSSPMQQNGKSSPGWSSPNRNHFYTERFALFSSSLKPVGKSKEKSPGVVNNDRQLSKHRGSNIYIEAKKHLSDMLKNGDGNAVSSKDGQFSKSLGRIISFPEYNRSPCRSPRKRSNDIIITPKMRLSPLGIAKNNTGEPLLENLDKPPNSRKQNPESQPCSLGSNSPDDAESPLKDNLSSSEVRPFYIDAKALEIEEVAESRFQEGAIVIDMSSELSSNSFLTDIRGGDTREVENEESASPFLQESSSPLKSDLLREVQISSPPMASPSHSLASREVDDCYHPIDKAEQPSPISILEPLFNDDEISPASTLSQPVEKEIQPRHIYFEEQPSPCELGICTRISLEDEESPFEYVEAVLLGSGLNWDDFLARWLSLYEILDSSLFDEVELFSSRPRHDQKLLFDCTNEALREVCETYFGHFSSVSDNKPTIRPVPHGMDLINETWKRVESHLVHIPRRSSLDQLVKIDLSRSRDWMKIQPEVEVTGFVIGEAVLDELVEDFLLCFVDALPLPVFGAESIAIEDDNL